MGRIKKYTRTSKSAKKHKKVPKRKAENEDSGDESMGDEELKVERPQAMGKTKQIQKTKSHKELKEKILDLRKRSKKLRKKNLD